MRMQLPSHDCCIRVPVKREKRLRNLCVIHPFSTFLFSLSPAEAQQAPAAQEAMEAQKVPAVPAMEAQEVPAVQVAVQVARKKRNEDTPETIRKEEKHRTPLHNARRTTS